MITYNQAEAYNTIGSTDYNMEFIEGSTTKLIDKYHSGTSEMYMVLK